MYCEPYILTQMHIQKSNQEYSYVKLQSKYLKNI